MLLIWVTELKNKEPKPAAFELAFYQTLLNGVQPLSVAGSTLKAWICVLALQFSSEYYIMILICPSDSLKEEFFYLSPTLVVGIF